MTTKTNEDQPRLIVISGQIDYTKLNTTLDPKEYAIGKAGVWTQMLNKGNRPKKWLKPRKKGTKVNFVVMQTEDEFDEAFEELRSYLTAVKEEHGVDIKLTLKEG